MQYSHNVRVAAEIILDGGVIAYPTEGVFGLGCDPWNAEAVSRILAIKRRPMDKGLIVIGQSLEQLLPLLVDLTDEQKRVLSNSWPGPTTWVVPHNGQLPYWVTGGRDTIAVRVSNHPLARALCHAAQSPIISTSANRSGKPALETSLQVRQRLGTDVDYVLGGRVQTPGQASTITDLLSGQQFRL